MIIIPAIDIIGGKTVRLTKGDYGRVSGYEIKPSEAARAFYNLGARLIHVVDLEGARDGSPKNFAVIKDIASVGAKIEVGGGIRDMKTLDSYFTAGVSRAVIGTAAVEDEAFLLAALAKYGDKIAVGIDMKDGFVALHGWKKVTDIRGEEFLIKMASFGVRYAIVTDISRDGAMNGVNLELFTSLTKKTGMNIIASGGVSTYDDIKNLKNSGVYGAIIGKALYLSALSLDRAIKLAEEE